jgi:hypothetical protein
MYDISSEWLHTAACHDLSRPVGAVTPIGSLHSMSMPGVYPTLSYLGRGKQGKDSFEA